jgi:hypothetical protein
MLIHHIKPEQFPQLERLFGMETKSGLEIPPWLRSLRDTAQPTSISNRNSKARFAATPRTRSLSAAGPAESSVQRAVDQDNKVLNL